MTGANFEHISCKAVSMSFSSLGLVSCCCHGPNPALRSTHPSSSNPLMNARNSSVLSEILRSIVSAKDSGFFFAAAVDKKCLKHDASVSNRKAQPIMNGLEKVVYVRGALTYWMRASRRSRRRSHGCSPASSFSCCCF